MVMSQLCRMSYMQLGKEGAFTTADVKRRTLPGLASLTEAQRLTRCWAFLLLL
jgi:hypothetical protein